jgi:hypothetical protein
LRVKATPVPLSCPMLPKTMAWTLTAVPRWSGILVQAPVDPGPLVVPGIKDGIDGQFQLLQGLLGERPAVRRTTISL